MKKKIRIGIDVDEILRAKWIQFDKFYVDEFGEDGVPEKEYVYDFFEGYDWNPTTEVVKELKEPEDMPEDINPIDYQVDGETGEAPADFAIFKKNEEVNLTAKEVYNRFVYQDYLLEIHGTAPFMYRNLDVDITNFYMKYREHVDFVITSIENELSIPPTLFFLSKMLSKFKNYRFVNDISEMWEGIDMLITTDPKIIGGGIPEGKHLIKLSRPYNKDSQDGSIKGEILQINDLNGDEEFEKLINFDKKELENE